MVKKIMLSLILLYGIKANCQVDEPLLAFDYFFNTANLDESRNSSEIDLSVNIPFTFGKAQFKNALKYNRYNFDFENDWNNYESIENLHKIGYDLSILYPLTKDWKLKTNANLTLASNLKGTMDNEDFLFTGGLSFAKKYLNSVFELGLGYYTFLGKPKLLPTISYSKKVNETVSFTLGFPYSNFSYAFNDRSSITTDIDFNGSYINFGNSIMLDDNSFSDKIEFNTTKLILGYNYKMDSNWTISINAGGYLFDDYTLTNSTTNNKIDFNLFKSPFISTGVKFNIKNKNQ